MLTQMLCEVASYLTIDFYLFEQEKKILYSKCYGQI